MLFGLTMALTEECLSVKFFCEGLLDLMVHNRNFVFDKFKWQ